MKDGDSFLSFTELKECLYVKRHFLVYHGVVSCIKLLRNATTTTLFDVVLTISYVTYVFPATL